MEDGHVSSKLSMSQNVGSEIIDSDKLIATDVQQSNKNGKRCGFFAEFLILGFMHSC